MLMLQKNVDAAIYAGKAEFEGRADEARIKGFHASGPQRMKDVCEPQAREIIYAERTGLIARLCYTLDPKESVAILNDGMRIFFEQDVAETGILARMFSFRFSTTLAALEPEFARELAANPFRRTYSPPSPRTIREP